MHLPLHPPIKIQPLIRPYLNRIAPGNKSICHWQYTQKIILFAAYTLPEAKGFDAVAQHGNFVNNRSFSAFASASVLKMGSKRAPFKEKKVDYQIEESDHIQDWQS